MATPTFVTATQKWVMNRITEVKEWAEERFTQLREMIQQEISDRIKGDNTLSLALSKLHDFFTTGKLKVEGDAEVTNTLKVGAGITANGLLSTGPIATTDAAGLLVKTPGREPTGLNSTTLSIVNERGKMARFFMRGDKLVYDYNYDHIYTYFNPALGCTLRYLHRGPTPLAQLVKNIEQYETDNVRLTALDQYFNIPGPEGSHPPARMFNTTVFQLFPALGTPFMIPESLLFECPAPYVLGSIKVFDSTGHVIKVLRDFRGTRDRQGEPIRKLLINFPYIHSANESPATQGVVPPPRRDEAEDTLHEEVSSPNGIIPVPGVVPVSIPHVADYDNGYYEFTDRDAYFHEMYDTGLVPNCILRLSDFKRDLPSVIYFDVVNH